MRSFLVAISLALLVCARPSPGGTDELKAGIVEQFNENCSAVKLTLIMRKYGGNSANLILDKGQRSPFLPLDLFDSVSSSLLHGEMKWVCGDTFEKSECDSEATHVRVERAATGRETKFVCYRIQSCKPGQTKLDTLDDRCREETLRVGSARIKWLETKENIPSPPLS